jgi:hypothetical protein
MPVHNADVAEIFSTVADLLDIQGANQFRIRACRNAARTVSSLPQSVAAMVADKNMLAFLSLKVELHPSTGGRCMGDGQHGRAAAEWVMIIRNLFIRKEDDRLLLASGIFPEWLSTGEELSFGPTLTPFGPLSMRMFRSEGALFLHVDGAWYDRPPTREIRVPGYETRTITGSGQSIELEPL